MKNPFLIFIVIILLLSCSNDKKKKTIVEKETIKNESVTEMVDSLNSQQNESASTKTVVERYFPKEKEIAEFDTTIAQKDLRISIENRFLDSSVVVEFENDGINYIDKYRDIENHLVIKNSNEILIDTVLRKNDFIELAGQEFLEIANFHRYWFNNIESDTIELFGVISKPETDWSFAFYHYFDLRTKTFKIKQHLEERI